MRVARESIGVRRDKVRGAERKVIYFRATLVTLIL